MLVAVQPIVVKFCLMPDGTSAGGTPNSVQVTVS